MHEFPQKKMQFPSGKKYIKYKKMYLVMILKKESESPGGKIMEKDGTKTVSHR